jgi:hypothetical protein
VPVVERERLPAVIHGLLDPLCVAFDFVLAPEGLAERGVRQRVVGRILRDVRERQDDDVAGRWCHCARRGRLARRTRPEPHRGRHGRDNRHSRRGQPPPRVPPGHDANAARVRA